MPRIAPKTFSVTGYKHFLTPLRRLIFDYDPLSPAQHGVRAYLRKPLLAMAEANPDVEVLVRKLRRGKAAVLRGHYGMTNRFENVPCDDGILILSVNGRDKVICVNKLEANEVEKKVGWSLSFSLARYHLTDHRSTCYYTLPEPRSSRSRTLRSRLDLEQNQHEASGARSTISRRTVEATASRCLHVGGVQCMTVLLYSWPVYRSIAQRARAA